MYNWAHCLIRETTITATTVDDGLLKSTEPTTPSKLAVFLAAPGIKPHMIITMLRTARGDERTNVTTLMDQDMVELN
jgi:hypothetical protein